MCHVTAVSAAVNVTYLAAPQVPGGADVHCSQVVSAKQTAYLECVAAGLGQSGVYTHGLETGLGQQFCLTLKNGVNHLTGIVNVDNCLVCYCGIVAAAVCVNN